jgi:flagellar hook-length control protein FliK
MQTNTLPIQVSGASASNAPQRANGNADAGQFSAALSREIEQRRPLPPAPPAQQPSRPQAASKPQAADKPAQADANPDAKADATADAKAPVPEHAPAEAQSSAKTAADDTAAADDAQDAGAVAQQANPIADMLALVASFNQLIQKNATVADGAARAAASTSTAVDAASRALPGAAASKPADADQLTALQAAVKRLGKDDGDTAQSHAKASDDSATPGSAADQRAPLPDALRGVERKGAAPEAADLRAASEAMGQAKTQPGGAELSAQQVRDFAAQLDAMKTPAPAAQFVVQARAAEGAVQVAAAAGEHLPARVGSQAWDNQVSQKVVWMVAGGEQSASLTLNPPDLGPMQVVLNVNGDQASVTFSSNQLEVRQALENALPRLREMMGESGIALGSATVGTGMPDQRQAQGEQADGRSGGGTRHENGQADGETAPRTATRTTVLGDRGLVDTFA